MVAGLANKFGRVFWLLTWLLGLALIVYGTPLYHTLSLADREQVAGFRPNRHELITVGYERPPEAIQFWQFLPKPLNRMLLLHDKPRCGDSIYLRDLDSGTRQRLDLSLGSVYALTCCKTGDRLCVMFGPDRIQSDDEDFRVAVIDIRTSKPIRVVHRVDPASMSISDDGKVLLYFRRDEGGKLGTCIDVDNGKILPSYAYDAVEDGFLSPGGNRLATAAQPSGWGKITQSIIDLKPRSLINEITIKRTGPLEPGFCRDWPFKLHYYYQGLGRALWMFPQPTTTSAFSSDERLFLDLDGNLWDLATNKSISRTSGPTAFVDNGQKLAWVERQNGQTAIRWRDLAKQRDLDDRTTWLVDSPTCGIDAADAAGTFVYVFAARRDNRETWRSRVLRWRGIPFPGIIAEEWLLLDGGSGSVLHRGEDYLLAVSSDGRYAVSGNMEPSRVKIHELPLHRSIQFMAIGAAAWTVLLGGFRHWFRRRLKPLLVDVSDSIEPTASA
jgi:hypothetical protein